MEQYLATTGLSDIWDLESEIILLGPWCAVEKKNKRLLEGRRSHVISSPWKPTSKIMEAEDYCYEIYKALIPRFSGQLNCFHGVEYPDDYWRVLLGPWLLHFIGVFYDRFKRMEKAFEAFPDSYTHALPLEECSVATLDNYDLFADKVSDDSYNLKLFSFIAHELYPQKIREIRIALKHNFSKIEFSYNWKAKIFNILTKDFLAEGNILLIDMYHLSNFDKLFIKLRSGFNNIAFTDFYSKDSSSLDLSRLNRELRDKLEFTGARDEFQTLLYKLLPLAIPLAYIENYKIYADSIESMSKLKKVRFVGSSIGWFYNEYFKFFAAKSILQGAKLIDFQHGGGFESLLVIPQESLSLEKDRFYVWGNKARDNSKMTYLPSPHLYKIRDKYKQENNRLLFIGTIVPKYHYRFTSWLQPEDIPGYFKNKAIFLDKLPAEIRNNVLYRPSKEVGWDEIGFIRERHPNINYMEGGRLISWMKKVSLAVIDHPHTTFLEALAINVPLVLYWDHDIYLMRKEAEEYFELLRKAGILFKDPESAARKVNEIYKNSLEWWQSKEIQLARIAFCNRYAHSDKNWMKIWVNELMSLDNPASHGNG